MFDELTPEQATELVIYAAEEPFGEVRADLRHANLIGTYLRSKTKKAANRTDLEFMLYRDIAEAGREKRVADDLVSTLDAMAARQERSE